MHCKAAEGNGESKFLGVGRYFERESAPNRHLRKGETGGTPSTTASSSCQAQLKSHHGKPVWPGPERRPLLSFRSAVVSLAEISLGLLLSTGRPRLGRLCRSPGAWATKKSRKSTCARRQKSSRHRCLDEYDIAGDGHYYYETQSRERLDEETIA